jgi:hypothetical protein
VASGPSLKDANLAALRGRAKVIAIKENVNRCPWADLVYGCDPAWWRWRNGLPEFKGIKMAWAGAGLAGDFPDIHQIHIANGIREKYLNGLSFERGTVGGGGNSGFQAFNLSLQFTPRLKGSVRILVGFDLDLGRGVHWYGRNRWPMANNPDSAALRRWCQGFENMAPLLKSKGIRVINTSRDSAIKCFEKMSIEQALAVWDETKQFSLDRL